MPRASRRVLSAGELNACLLLSDLAAHVMAAYLDTGDPAVLAHYDGGIFCVRFLSRRCLRRAMTSFRHPTWYELALAMLR